MASKNGRNGRVKDLLLNALETEVGGVQIYETALRCAQNDELKEEWSEYRDQTQHHQEVLRKTCEAIGVDPDEQTPGRKVVHHIGGSLVQAMEMALEAGDPVAAELAATECVTAAETMDHHHWQLIGELGKKSKGEEAKALRAAHDEVEDEEDEHLYHTRGWSRELWIQALGMKAVLPPPEEEKDVKSAIGAERAKNAREEML
jgi:rubrerythrin